jgi:hypothetical protein
MSVTKSLKVHIKHKKIATHRVGEGVDMNVILNKNKIGSSLRNRSVLRGLSFEEEKIYMPTIIGFPSDAPNFQKACEEYWKDISVVVPPPSDSKFSDGGLELEVGFVYSSKEAAEKGEAEATSEFTKFNDALEKGKEYNMKFDVRSKVGKPIELNDFVLWRYCLKYGRVANREQDIKKSRKIDFYMTNPQLELKLKKDTVQLRKDAYLAFAKISASPEKSANLFYVLEKERKEYVMKTQVELNANEPTDVELLLEHVATKKPATFLKAAKDKNIEMRAFIARCIETGHLRRVPNTDRIIYGDNEVIGSSTNDAIAFLMSEKEPRNQQVRQELEAKLQYQKK